MTRLRQFAFSPNYYVCWHDGERSRRLSTGTANLEKAENWLEQAQQRLSGLGRADLSERLAKSSKPKRRASRWYVYVVGCQESTLVKIGHCSKSASVRLKILQIGSPVRLHLRGCAHFATRAAAETVERFIHHELKVWRRHGEWFDYPADQALAHIKGAAEGNVPRGYWAMRLKAA